MGEAYEPRNGMTDLTPKQEAFALAYIETGNASEAYRRAYDVRPDTKPESVWVNASKILSDAKVSQRVSELATEAATMAGLNAYKTMRELSRIGFSDLRRLFTEAGALRDPATWDDDIAAAVASIEVVTRQGAETDADGNRAVEYVHKVKLWDKNSALDKIGRHLGMLVDRHEHTGKNGAPLLPDASTTDLAKALVILLNSARQEDTP